MVKLIWPVHQCLLATIISLRSVILSIKSITNIHIHYLVLFALFNFFIWSFGDMKWILFAQLRASHDCVYRLRWKRNLITRNHSLPVLDIQCGDISSARVYMWVNSSSHWSYVLNPHFSTTCKFFPLYVSGCKRLMSCILMLHVKHRLYSLYLPPS